MCASPASMLEYSLACLCRSYAGLKGSALKTLWLLRLITHGISNSVSFMLQQHCYYYLTDRTKVCVYVIVQHSYCLSGILSGTFTYSKFCFAPSRRHSGHLTHLH